MYIKVTYARKTSSSISFLYVNYELDTLEVKVGVVQIKYSFTAHWYLIQNINIYV